MEKKVLSDKILVLGVDGMDPRLSKKYIDEGKMPNFKKLCELGAQRSDLVMLGSLPTVTPPQWTTLACGCHPVVHGITQFSRVIPGRINQWGYNIDSRNYKAEQIWNCTAEAGYNTLVLHWPGSSWPPTSDSDKLFVIDGSAPGGVGSASMQICDHQMIGASVNTEEVTFATLSQKEATSPCIINRMPKEQLEPSNARASHDIVYNTDEKMIENSKAGIDTIPLLIKDSDGYAHRVGNRIRPVNTCISPIKEATGWANAPANAKEFTALFSDGKIRRVGLILQNEDGIYDHIALYKSKKETEPMFTAYVGKMVYNVIDDNFYEDERFTTNRHFKLLELKEDGSELSLFASAAMDMNCDTVIHPKRLHKAFLEEIGPYPPHASIYTQDPALQECEVDVWEYQMEWYVKVLDYMIKHENMQMIFSHFHSIDLVEHTFIRHMYDYMGINEHPAEVYAYWMQRLYEQVDRYIGKMLHYLDEDWTIMVVSDHALVGPYFKPPAIGDMTGINVGLMKELGYTVLQKDENGNEIRKIDWSKTRAIASQGNDIFINLKGREPHGIVDPAVKYELEEQIITDLYSYKHPESGKRVIALALHNKDALLLGYGGPTAGDVCFWVAEGYNYDHTDSLSTTYGPGDTSTSPIFAAAGKGIKKGYTTDRIIRQIDFAPTISVLSGCRLPKQCEGAPIYQIIDDKF